MKILVDPATCTAADLAPAVEWLRTGGIVAFPTDTLYALGIDPASSAAVKRLLELKERVEGSALPFVAASRAQVEAFCGVMDDATGRLASRFWPGPLSVVLDAPASVDPAVHGGLASIAIRVPRHRVAQTLAAAFGRPLTSTSANRHGQAPVQRASDLDPAIAGHVLVVDGGPTPGGMPSTIVDARARPPRLLRGGAVPWNRVLESLKA
jgi:L-threonylcarbamoyladenylate synthase